MMNFLIISIQYIINASSFALLEIRTVSLVDAAVDNRNNATTWKMALFFLDYKQDSSINWILPASATLASTAVDAALMECHQSRFKNLSNEKEKLIARCI